MGCFFESSFIHWNLFGIRLTVLPLVGRKDWGISPQYGKLACPPMSPHYFDPNCWLCNFHAVFGILHTLSPPPVDPIWETLTYEILKARQSKNYKTAYNRVSTDLEKPTKSEKLVCFSKNQGKSRRLMKKLWILLAFRENSVNFEWYRPWFIHAHRFPYS